MNVLEDLALDMKVHGSKQTVSLGVNKAVTLPTYANMYLLYMYLALSRSGRDLFKLLQPKFDFR